MLEPLDPIWLTCAARVEIFVERGGDAYVHWDGRALHIADPEHLDADDSLAQLVLHEICHLLVEGEAARDKEDWGLGNTSDRDAVREEAAVRLQAHLAGAFALRDALYPTTVVRAIFDALGDDAFAPADTEAARLARVAALRAAKDPYKFALESALEATANALGRPRHASGFPLHPGAATCGGCGWRTDGGYCRLAPRLRASPDERACARFEAAIDCAGCGACCRSAYDTVIVGPRDPVIKRQPQLVVARERTYELRRDGDRCAALAGGPGGPFHCAIYDDRPRTCRDFERAGRHCLDARRKVGLSI